jgi:L-asparaginase II
MSHYGHQAIFELTRGGIVESVHYGSAAVCDTEGKILKKWGDADTVTFLRSCAKPFQALPLVENGALEHFSISQQELALICSSHSGTDEHVRVLDALHQKLNLSVSDLQCGTHDPYHIPTSDRLKKKGEALTAKRHNCSGKHTGMLALAKYLSAPLNSYLEQDHPAQISGRAALAEVAGLAPNELISGIDGCSAPNFALTVARAATAYARLIDARQLSEKRKIACKKIADAMMAFPDMVGGPERFDTLLMSAQPNDFVVKGGAEGYLCMALRPGLVANTQLGIGVAIKIADGDPTGRARHGVAMMILKELGVLKKETFEVMKDFGPDFEIKNQRQTITGYGRPVSHS